MFSNSAELLMALGEIEKERRAEIERLFSEKLPPVISVESLATMFGYNPGFIYSMLLSPKAHYREFDIPKGRKSRNIIAPKVGIKAIQTWLAHHFSRNFVPHTNVHGFVPGRSHITAASEHLRAKWVFSIDIENFFPSITIEQIQEALQFIGYTLPESVLVLGRLVSLRQRLVQGAPTSPVISNVVLRNLDQTFCSYAAQHNYVYTRYADDIVFSGKNCPPTQIEDDISKILIEEGWKISEQKTSLDIHPKRLKVHGLLVHGGSLRLTKGYRNKIRAYQHLLKHGKIRDDEVNVVAGHINYAKQISSASQLTP